MIRLTFLAALLAVPVVLFIRKPFAENHQDSREAHAFALHVSIPDSIKAGIDAVVKVAASQPACRMTCRVTDSEGRVYYSGYDGNRKQPIRDFTGFIEIGSCTKMFTATAILQLIEQQMFSLDDPLTKLLPDPALYQGLAVHDGRDYIDSIRVRHLLNHSSGFADYFVGNDSTEIAVHGDSTLRFTPRQLVRSAARINKPKFRPGTSFGYSNVNYILLGMIIEKYALMSYHTYIQRNILDPLRLTHTFFATVNSPAARAPGHYEGKPTEMPATMAGAAGEIVSTLDDMHKFISAWHQEKLFRKPGTMTMVKTALFNDMGPGIRYGLGVIDIMGNSLGHAGQTFGFSAYMGILPDGSSFVFGIDDAAATAWTPALALTTLLAGKR